MDDNTLVQEALNTDVKTVESLYWALEDAVYDQKTGIARCILESFDYLKIHNHGAYMDGLRDIHRQRISEMKDELSGKMINKTRHPIETKLPIKPVKLPFKKEHKLRDFLYMHPEVIGNALNDKVEHINKEVQTDGEYKCDLTIENQIMFYPIELKISPQSHVDSQIRKYCYYFYRQLRYSRFRQIQGIVISNGFDTWGINELRREGFWIYLIRPDADHTIALSRVD